MSDSREQAHRSASDAELVCGVDEADRVLGALPRAELRARGLIGRGTFVFVFNSAGEVCVHQRTWSKAVYPGYWDLAAGGMVLATEDYALSAQRELAEELGVEGVELQLQGRFFFDAPDNRLWGAVFAVRWDGLLRPQPEEVQGTAWVHPRDLSIWQRDHRVCPDTWLAYEHFGSILRGEQAGVADVIGSDRGV